MAAVNYTYDSGSKLPNTPMVRHNFKDVTDDIADLIEQVKTLQSEGKYAEAANIIESHNLKDYVLSAEYINLIDEETRNLEIMCKSKKQSVYYMEDEPRFSDNVGDVWIGGE